MSRHAEPLPREEGPIGPEIPPSTVALLRYFLYLGSLGFGGPVALARRAITDVPTLLIAVVALGILWRFKVPEPVLIAAGAAAGLLIFSIRG